MPVVMVVHVLVFGTVLVDFWLLSWWLCYKSINTCIHHLCTYSGPCILRPPVQPTKCGLKLKVVLKRRDIYIGNIRVVSLVAHLEGIVKHVK